MNELQEVNSGVNDNYNVLDMKDYPRLKFDVKGPTGGNWLSDLPFETRFLAFRKANQGHTLEDFLVGSDPKLTPWVYLGYNLSLPEGGFKFVDPVKFCRDYELYGILKIEVEKNDGTEV